MSLRILVWIAVIWIGRFVIGGDDLLGFTVNSVGHR